MSCLRRGLEGRGCRRETRRRADITYLSRQKIAGAGRYAVVRRRIVIAMARVLPMGQSPGYNVEASQFRLPPLSIAPKE